MYDMQTIHDTDAWLPSVWFELAWFNWLLSYGRNHFHEIKQIVRADFHIIPSLSALWNFQNLHLVFCCRDTQLSSTIAEIQEHAIGTQIPLPFRVSLAEHILSFLSLTIMKQNTINHYSMWLAIRSLQHIETKTIDLVFLSTWNWTAREPICSLKVVKICLPSEESFEFEGGRGRCNGKVSLPTTLWKDYFHKSYQFH